MQKISVHLNLNKKWWRKGSLPQKFSGHGLPKLVVLLAIMSTRKRRSQRVQNKQFESMPLWLSKRKTNFHATPHIYLCLHRRKQVYHVSCFSTRISNCFSYLGIPHGSQTQNYFLLVISSLVTKCPPFSHIQSCLGTRGFFLSPIFHFHAEEESKIFIQHLTPSVCDTER